MGDAVKRFLLAGDRSVRPTVIHLALFLAIMVATDLLLLRGMGWSVIFWGHNRPRGPAIGFALLMIAAFAVCQRGIAFGLQDRQVGKALTATLIGAAAMSILTAFAVLQRFPNSGDEYAYWFGAETYLAGRLWNAAPPLGQLLASNYTWVAGGKWAGQYPPGWPATLAAATAVGISPWIVGTGLAGGTMLGLYALIRRQAGRLIATLGAMVFAAAPFTIFTAASLHSHTLAAALGVGTMVTIARAAISRSIGWPILAGILIGALGVTRSVTAVAILLPFLVSLAWRRDVRTAVLVGIGGLPFIALLLWYQGSITGDPLKPVYWLSGRNVDHLYFDGPSIRIGLTQTLTRLAGLSVWTVPVLPLAWLYAFLHKLYVRRVGVADFVFPLGVFIFVFYPLHFGNGYGPRYYFDVWPLMIYTVASALPDVQPAIRRGIEAVLVLSIVYGIALWPVLAADFSRITHERRDLYDQVAALGIRHAAVCIRSGTSPSLPMPVSDLARNGVEATGSVLYARCDTVAPSILFDVFPDRSLWVYDRAPDAVRGRLTRIR
ncbi:MAG TPA: hypothetical protein VF649_01840 [Sphingomonas sp.]|jgi:hypothetical protein|uniref:hypothetical protein n=1 Tax=Sphingomonas sp. TaxID=28214 RepID=UPI002EDB0A47